MEIVDALQADKCTVISLVGSGGKTSLMFRLARELAAAGKRVVTTTTTHIMKPLAEESPACMISEDPLARLAEIEDVLCHGGSLTLAARQINDDGKLKGYAPEIIDSLAELDCIDTIIVEADGAGRKPLKACAAHEPVLARRTDLLVAVAGLDSIGGKVADTVFRPEIFSKATGLEPDDRVTPESIANILCTDLEKSAGGLSARKVIVLNKADDKARLAAAEVIVAALSIAPNLRLQQALIVSLADSTKPVRKKYIFPAGGRQNCNVAGIILAAGRAQRMGAVKGLLPFGSSTILQNVVDSAERSRLSFVRLVLGHEAALIRERISCRRTSIVCNESYAHGQSSSLQAGLTDLPESCEYGMFLLGDQPLLKQTTIDRLLAAADASVATIIVPEYQGRRGNPVLIHKALFPQIHKLSGDVGARPLLISHDAAVWFVTVDDPGILTDIDTPEDYAAIAKK